MNTGVVAIIGAGPYGLSIAAHLRARGVPYRIFGDPMQTWRPMPRSLSLKSLGFATSLAIPERGTEFPTWLAAHGLEALEPISYADFTQYGLELQRRFVPDCEPATVSKVEAVAGGRFALTLQSGERIEARAVVVAVGVGPFQRLPPELAALGRALVSHTFGNYVFAGYAGQRVAVIGAGQSALEAAVLLHEVGAEVQLISRDPPIFHGRTPRNRPLLDRVREPLTVLGAGRKNWVLEHLPWAVRYAPERPRVRLARNYLGPAGAWWLRDRFEGKVQVTSPATLVSVHEAGGRAVLRIARPGGPERHEEFAHVVCGTGFEHDLRRLWFLDPLRGRVKLIQGRAPRLSRQFESSVPGLFFVGPFSAYAFGPLFRFVCGVTYTAPTVARHLALTGRRRPWTGRQRPLPSDAPPSVRAA
jgi:FAD-dependent urate hydroxylase